jgi:hypothetical protein
MKNKTLMDDGVRPGGGGLRAVQTATQRPMRQGPVQAASRWAELRRRLEAYDGTIRRLLGRSGPMLLRISLGIVFV